MRVPFTFVLASKLTVYQRLQRLQNPSRQHPLRVDRGRPRRTYHFLPQPNLYDSQTVQGLFKRIGPIRDLKLMYDRAGRSEGVAFVTYESHQDAKDAIREFDGANAAGMSYYQNSKDMSILTEI